MEDFDRVQENTEESVNRELMSEADARIRMSRSASQEEITARIQELDQEWDIERALEMKDFAWRSAIRHKYGLPPVYAANRVAVCVCGQVLCAGHNHICNRVSGRKDFY